MPIRAPADTLCLAFVDTRYWRASAAPTETLKAPADLVNFLARRAGLPVAATDALRARAAAAPDGGAAMLREGVAARETIHRLFDAAADEKPPPPDDLAALNQALAAAPARNALTTLAEGMGRGAGWAADLSGVSLAALLAPVIWSAADLLASADRRRIRRCGNPDCGSIFVDESRAGSRRWCDMASCGNRMKARRHYLRSKDKA